MRLVLTLLLAWAGFVLLWFLFVFQLTGSEFLFGSVASAAAVVSGCATLRAVPLCFKPRFRWIAQAYRLPLMVLTDMWLLAKHLCRTIARRPSRSRFLNVHFHAVADDCQGAAQRALAVLLVSTTPNSIVLDINREEGRLLFHQVTPDAVPEIMARLQG